MKNNIFPKLRLYAIPAIATAIIGAFWFNFKEEIPMWWTSIMLSIPLGQLAYRQYIKSKQAK